MEKEATPESVEVPTQNAHQRTTLIQSYVEDRYFVSTIYRQCSAIEAHGLWYYETCAFEWDFVTKKTGAMIEHKDSGLTRDSALRDHSDVCAALVFSGKGVP